ncbi:hypothetical protein PYCC9005_002350 [Savitreella phatthalungensis]
MRDQSSRSPTKQDEASSESSSRVSIRDRIDHFTWPWFTCTQSTGGVAVLLSETPHQFNGLQTIGVIIFIFNLALFSIFICLMATRFILNPRKLRTSLTTGPECFFFGSFWLTIATIIFCMEQYAVGHTGDWIITAIRVVFWIYAAVTFCSTTVHLVVIASHADLDPLAMSPAWFLLIFNAMLTGTVASGIAKSQPPAQRLPILVAGVAYQGLGWIVSILFLTFFMALVLGKGLPEPDQRPALFMPVGASGYTIVALIGCARYIPENYAYFARHPTAGEVLQIVALWSSIFMWLFTFFIFAFALVANLPTALVWKRPKEQDLPDSSSPLVGLQRRPQMHFKLAWWAIIFPNVGFTIATIYIGQELESPGILWVGSAQTIAVVIFWLMDLILSAKAVITRQIMYPGKDEDKNQ